MPAGVGQDTEELASTSTKDDSLGRRRSSRQRRLVTIAVRLSALAMLVGLACCAMTRMPGKSYAGPLLPLTQQESALRDGLRRDVEELAGEIGERHVWAPDRLGAAASFIETSLADAGYQVHRQQYVVGGQTCSNIEAEIAGTDLGDEIVIVGAHYDTVPGSPGANDNASGVAGVLALARLLAGSSMSRTLRFVLFVNEEPPHFHTEQMGSMVYAERCRERGENVVAMVCLETIGYYSDEKGSQSYPFPFSVLYPSTGNFIGFVGNLSSRGLVRKVVGAFRRHAHFPSEGGAVPAWVPGVGWSDHWSFWQQGYPALMVTDTAPFRYPYYHSHMDTPDMIDYDRMARVVGGLEGVVAELAGLVRE